MNRFATLTLSALTTKQREDAIARIEEICESVAGAWPGFHEREGQVKMIAACAETLLSAKPPGEGVRDGSNIGTFEAGTGTGKTVAYCIAAIVASEILTKPVVISTATVSLQEQLFFKDLPLLARIVPTLKFELLKGRGRYVCRARLGDAVDGDVMQDDWIESEGEDGAPPKAIELSEQTVQWFGTLSHRLENGAWDGEMDSIPERFEERDWRHIAADPHACGAQRCAHFKSCEFFVSRGKLKAANLLVANHSLVLSTLANASQLINPEETLFVLDEAHHLPEIATDQFADKIRIGQSRRVVAALRTAMVKANALLESHMRLPLQEEQKDAHEAVQKLLFVEDWIFESGRLTPEVEQYRFQHGVVDDVIAEHSDQIAKLLSGPLKSAACLKEALNERDEAASPKRMEERAKAANALSAVIAKVVSIERAFRAWATHDTIPLAKWMALADGTGNPDVWICASPLTGAQVLSRELWKKVGAAVCTSATITACGSFDYFDRLSGMRNFPKRLTGIMPSPFDFKKQGELRLSPMHNPPNSRDFSQELCGLLPEILASHEMGQLVLFTSKRQLQACYDALPSTLKKYVLVQGSQSRQGLLIEHGLRVKRGQSSILFGLQSLGEGLDLPGDLCRHVVIDKLPFTPPTSPVDEALSEWLATQGRDAFKEISVPKAAMRLAQWIGRGVRTVNDYAVITILDKRLGKTGYGKTILAGLPAFPVRVPEPA